MAYQIIKQTTHGLRETYYAIWDSISDELIARDLEHDEVVGFFADMAYRKAEQDTEEMLRRVITTDKPYFQFTKTWDEVRKKKTRI